MVEYINGSTALKNDNKIVSFSVYKNGEPEKKKGNYKTGEKQEVYPFRTDEDLQKMKDYFIDNEMWRDSLMFVLGVNVGLRAGDLLALTWKQVFSKDGKDVVNGITIREEKTDKWRTFYLNESCKNAITEYFDFLMADYDARIHEYTEKIESGNEGTRDYNRSKEQLDKCNYELEHIMDEYIFKSRKGSHIEVRPAGLILKKAAQAVGITYNVGTHSMRKTFGYRQLKAHQGDAMFVCQLQAMFNHSSPQITLRYCGLESEKMEQYYNDVCLL